MQLLLTSTKSVIATVAANPTSPDQALKLAQAYLPGCPRATVGSAKSLGIAEPVLWVFPAPAPKPEKAPKPAQAPKPAPAPKPALPRKSDLDPAQKAKVTRLQNLTGISARECQATLVQHAWDVTAANRSLVRGK